MIYTCQHCGAWFPANDVKAAVKNNETIISCKMCGNVNEFREMKSSHAARGYDYLSMGEFYRASYSFSTAIDDAKKHNHHPSPDAYLGYALSQFHIQTVFSDDDSARLELPDLICHKCNEMYFADSAAYMNALKSIEEEMELSMQNEEKQKIKRYADYIDSIKDYYDGISASRGSGFKYGAFIAYEDKNVDSSNRGYEYAGKVRNSLPDKVKNVFLPDIDEYENELEYEAAILYAIENSNCMLVITDDDIDSRLTNIYSRFYFNSREKKKGGNNLGFVRYCGHISISLPDKSIANDNIFDIENTSDYCHFALSKNGIHEIGKAEEFGPNELTDEAFEEELKADDFGEGLPYHSLPGKLISFGSYPQKRVQNQEIEEHFASLGRPSMSDSNGWTILSYTKKGNPHMWYRDDTIGGKKYRAVYFTKARELYTVQNSDIPNHAQKKNGYLPMRIYCFEFEPIVWNIKTMSNDIAVLVASTGMDSREFNNHALDNSWDSSSVHEWLNNEFVTTAFNETEQEYLGMLDSNSDNDRIYLVDKAFDSDYYHDQTNIHGTDYYKCIGGHGDFLINNYWITATVNTSDEEAGVVFPATNEGFATQYVDCSGVAVLPKIVIKLN